MQPYLQVFHPPTVFPPPRGGLLPIEPRRLPLGGERELDPPSQLFLGMVFPFGSVFTLLFSMLLCDTHESCLMLDTSTLFVISQTLACSLG